MQINWESLVIVIFRCLLFAVVDDVLVVVVVPIIILILLDYCNLVDFNICNLWYWSFPISKWFCMHLHKILNIIRESSCWLARDECVRDTFRDIKSIAWKMNRSINLLWLSICSDSRLERVSPVGMWWSFRMAMLYKLWRTIEAHLASSLNYAVSHIRL